MECEGDYDASEVALQRALTKAETVAQRASILNDVAWVMLRKGDIDNAQQFGKQALQLCDELEDSDRLRAQIFDHLGTIAEQQGKVEDAIAFHLLSRKVKEAYEDIFGVLESANNLGSTYQLAGQDIKALDEFEYCLTLSKQVGYTLGIATAMLNIGNVHEFRGDFEKTTTFCEDALQLFDNINHLPGAALCLGNLGALFQQLHQSEKARLFIEKALALNLELGDKEGLAFSKTWLAQNLLETADSEQAKQEALSALEFAVQANSYEQTAYAHRVLARVLRAQNDEELALREFEIALSLFQHLGNTPEANTVKHEIQLHRKLE